MANKRKKEHDQHVVVDSMAKATVSNMKSFETTEAEIKSKKAHTGGKAVSSATLRTITK